MTFSRHIALITALGGTLIFGGVPARSATAGLALQPGRLEIEVLSGSQKTAAFSIESPPSDEPVRGRLLLSLTDWMLSEDGSLTFQDAGSGPMSAAPWITFSPAATSIVSGQRALVRVTVDVPKNTAPGVYRAGIFVQERPPATPPSKGEHTILFRFRYVEVIYVIVPPVAADPHLADAGLDLTAKRPFIVCHLRNDGTAFVRPFITWSLRDESGTIIREEKAREATVLLPHVKLVERIPVDGLAPGKYEMSVAVDFQNGGPIQAMTRAVEISAPPVQIK